MSVDAFYEMRSKRLLIEKDLIPMGKDFARLGEQLQKAPETVLFEGIRHDAEFGAMPLPRYSKALFDLEALAAKVVEYQNILKREWFAYPELPAAARQEVPAPPDRRMRYKIR